MNTLADVLRSYPPEVQALWQKLGEPSDLRRPAARLAERLATAGRLERTLVEALCRYALELDRQKALLAEQAQKEQLEEALLALRDDEPLPPEWVSPPLTAYPPWDGFELLGAHLDRDVPERLRPLAALLLVLAFPEGAPDPALVADWAREASVLHYRNYELLEDTKVLTWHIAGLRSGHLRRRALAGRRSPTGDAAP